MAYRVTIHNIAKPDLETLREAGLSHLIDRAKEKMHMIADLNRPQEHNNVTVLKHIAPLWFRYSDGSVRIVFRFTKSRAELVHADTMQVTMLVRRNNKTYGADLKRRYQQLESD
jgi:hypothetical protein